jgi:sec-independent protein translocase protein TatC
MGFHLFKPQPQPMSVWDHLEEIRWRLISSIVVLVVFSILGFIFSNLILNFLIRPVPRLVFLSPAEAFLIHVKIGIVAGLVVSTPFLLYQLLLFLLPALKPEEKRGIVWILPMSLLFFFSGAAFSNFVLLPFAIKFFLSYSTGKIQEMISLSSYVDFVLSFLIAGGVVFEMPLVMMGLGKIGVVKSAFLRKYRKEAFLVILIATALLSPSPDVFSWSLLSLCMYGLFELSIAFVKLVEKG